jgi:hypothetical protein
MTLLCINPVTTATTADLPQVEVGGIYIPVEKFKRYGKDYYELQHHRGAGYKTGLFISIDPTEEDINEYSESEKQYA